MSKALTVKSVEAAKASEVRREIPDAACVGLYLFVSTTGSKSWICRYRLAGKPKKLTIGAVLLERKVPLADGRRPELGEGHTLAEARVAAHSALGAVKEGQDPFAEKTRAKKASLSGEDNVDAALDAYIDKHVEKNNRESTATETKRFLRLYVRPALGELKLRHLRKRQILDMLDTVSDKGGPASANRVFAIVRHFLVWSVQRDLLSTSPAEGIAPPSQPVSRDRYLDDAEIKLMWRGCQKVGWPFGEMAKLLLLTGQRREEVAGGRWKEFDLEAKEPMWIIPRSRAKNDNEHFVALSPSVVSVLQGLPRMANSETDHILTTTGKTGISGFSRAKEALDAAMLELARADAAERGTNEDKVAIAPWTWHDLRRTAASGMARLGMPVHVVEAVLNHKSGSVSGIAAVYNRHTYADEKRRALFAWAQHVESLITPSEGNVVPLRGRQ
jgi:integrase